VAHALLRAVSRLFATTSSATEQASTKRRRDTPESGASVFLATPPLVGESTRRISSREVTIARAVEPPIAAPPHHKKSQNKISNPINHFPPPSARSPHTPQLPSHRRPKYVNKLRIRNCPAQRSQIARPKTPEGKAKSSQNALRHGLTANSPTLPTEFEDDFQTLLDAYLNRYHPADAIEIELVKTLAITRWRLRRVGMIESCMLENEMEQSRPHLSWLIETLGDEKRVAFAFRNLANGGKALDLLIRYEASLTRAYDRAAKQLDQLQNRKVRNEPTEPVTHPSALTLREPWLPVGPDPTRAIPVVIKCTPPKAQDHSLRSPKP
jgi:hypothetical protein